jgi:hypothetical protein
MTQQRVPLDAIPSRLADLIAGRAAWSAVAPAVAPAAETE